MQRIAVDMDEVMADTLGELLARYSREQNTSLTKKDIEGKWLWQVLPPEAWRRSIPTCWAMAFLRTFRSSKAARKYCCG